MPTCSKYIPLIRSDSTTNVVGTKEFWVNMPNLLSHLKKVAEQKPQATYYNVDMIKYQVWKDLWPMVTHGFHPRELHAGVFLSGVCRGDSVYSSEPCAELAE